MRTFTAKEAKNRLGDVFRTALAGPVVITNHGKPMVRVASAISDDHKENAQDRLDRVKHLISCEVLARFSVDEIRQRAIANLERWRSQGTWGATYDEWLQILKRGDDHDLIACMVGLSERSNRLRQSMPYVGMLDQATVGRIREKA